MSQAAAEKTFRDALRNLLKLKKSGSNLRVTSKPYFMRFVYDASRKEVYGEVAGDAQLPESRRYGESALATLADLGYDRTENGSYLRVFDFSSPRGHDEACGDFVRVFTEVFGVAVEHGVAYELTLGDGSDTAVEKALNLAGKLLAAANRRNYAAQNNIDGFTQGLRGKGCVTVLVAALPLVYTTVQVIRHLLA
jgi:hypothetical protein